MQTDSLGEARMTNGWYGWQFHSVDDLQRALDEYASFRGVPMVQQYGGLAGGDADKRLAAHEHVLRQNAAIDKAMARLRSWGKLGRLGHALIDAYYRAGLSYEADGWRRALLRVGQYRNTQGDVLFDALFHHGQNKREWERERRLFEMLLTQAVDSLFVAHTVRPRRPLDATSGSGVA